MALREAQKRTRDIPEGLLEAIVESSIDALISKSTDGVILTWNPAAELLFGYRAEEAIGRHISLIIPPDRLHEEELILARLRSGERISRFETVRRHQDGHQIPVELTISPIRDATGRVIGASKVARDLTDRDRLETSLRAASAELTDQNRRKDEFIATLAHELRNPLAAIRTSVSILRSPRLATDTLESTRLILERQVTQMARLLDDLLDVSRVTRGRLELRLDIVELHGAIDDAITVARPAFAAAGVALHSQITPTLLLARADAARVQQMVDNVLTNAAKYTPRGGVAQLTVDVEGTDLVISVTDTGIGIGPAELEQVFEMFSTVRSEKVAWKNGLGVGLCLVKRLAVMHGGDITAHSAGRGTGSTFVIRLPVLIPSAGVASETVPRAAPHEINSSSAHCVLIVEDDADNAEALQMFLRAHGCHTAVARDGRSALAQAAELAPAVVILDLGLPDMNGWEICRQLKATGGAVPYVVALTGWGQSEARQRTQEAGVDQHLVKPVDPTALLAILAAHVPEQPVVKPEITRSADHHQR